VIFHVWFLPFILLVTAILIAFPLSRYLAWIMDGKYQPVVILKWIEKRLNGGPQNWKQYAGALLLFNTILFVFSYLVLALQPWLPLNPEGKTLLAPSAILNAASAFITNADLQHYSGEKHFSNFSQLVFGLSNFFLSAATGLCALVAIIRALRSDLSLGNYFLDMWRVVAYLFLPLATIIGVIFIAQGCPMTFASSTHTATLESDLVSQKLVVGPVAAFEAMKMLGTNGGGFYTMNSAHPYENPSDFSNFINMLSMLLLPFAIVLMYGRMLNRHRHGLVIFSLMLFLTACVIVWAIVFDTLAPNPGLIAHPAYTYGKIAIPSVAGLPVDQHLGNLEGKEMRFGTSAGATFAALTALVSCGAVNAEIDSLNPIAGLAPMIGMWLNCIFGGKGAGMINILLFIVIGIFLAGMMVGRTPEYLGKKIGAREVKLAIIALLVHPFMILIPTGLFAATDWGIHAVSNPGAHGLSQMLYQFSSASANNGSALNGLGVVYGFWDNPHPAPQAMMWDIATGLIMIFSRFLPIIAPIAMAAFLGAKKTSPFGLGSLRDDTATFGFLLLGTIFIIGALQFLPVAALGPIAEQLGPIPFAKTSL
jgi:K+-transporting ATPase ATPase A chain